MRTHVYANGDEIACKAAGSDGTSPAAFPDPCWSPPAPSAGPVVVPYPNTCEATHITQGSVTVFICGEQVALEDSSYFSTSTGNEGATRSFGQGVASGTITGKAYFTQWSFDVIVEGHGVPRHLDLVTHNHGSMPANTLTFPYLSRGILRNDCKDEQRRIERACGPESEHSDTRKALRKESRLHKLLKANDKGRKGRKWHWTHDHCDGLDVPLSSAEEARAYAEKMQEVFKSLPDELNILGAMEHELTDMATKAGAKALAKWAAKAGLKQAAGSSVPAIGNALMGIWSVVDGALAIGDVNEIRRVATESMEKISLLRDKVGELSELGREFENFKSLDPQAQAGQLQDLGARGQEALATLNDCTRARKCQLTPYAADGAHQRGREHSSNKGCCKGQTGHHLIYGAMMDGACPGYSRTRPNDQMHKDAPTVCVEGTTQHAGSHGRVHDKMDKEVALLARKGKLQDGTMSLDQAIDAATQSHKEAFPASRCSHKCIRNQLESFYREKCPNARPKAVDKHGNVPGSDGGTVQR